MSQLIFFLTALFIGSHCLASIDLASDERVLLNRRLAQAQKAFLEMNQDQAIQGFKAVTQLAHTNDWTGAARENIHYAFLRLGQLCVRPEERSQALKDAVVFAPDLEPDKSVFPPPFIKKFALIKSTHPTEKLVINGAMAEFDELKINGKSFALHFGKVITWPQGVVRTHWTGDHWYPHMTTMDLQHWSPSSVKLTPKVKKKEMNLKPALATEDTPLPTNSMTPKITSKMTPKKWYYNKWLWVGAGLVTATVIHRQKNEKPARVRPTHQ